MNVSHWQLPVHGCTYNYMSHGLAKLTSVGKARCAPLSCKLDQCQIYVYAVMQIYGKEF